MRIRKSPTIPMTYSYYHEEYTVKERSVEDIANEWHTYPNKILRMLKKLKIKLRDKSSAQTAALKAGRSKNPNAKES